MPLVRRLALFLFCAALAIVALAPSGPEIDVDPGGVTIDGSAANSVSEVGLLNNAIAFGNVVELSALVDINGFQRRVQINGASWESGSDAISVHRVGSSPGTFGWKLNGDVLSPSGTYGPLDWRSDMLGFDVPDATFVHPDTNETVTLSALQIRIVAGD